MHSIPASIAPTLDAWSAALRRKDLDDLRACYAPDVAVYDIGSHLVGFDALAELWASCFPYFTDPIEVERKDILATVSETVVAMSFLARAWGHGETDPAANSWYRCTMVFENREGGWLITQEHSSIAYDFATNALALILDG